jgi:protein O-mannosyl-transferase
MAVSSPSANVKTKKKVSFSSESPVLPYRHLDRINLALSLGLITAVFVCYSSVVRNQFVYFDDNLYIMENAHVNAGLTWQTVIWAFSSYYQSNWHPLTWLSHALDVSLFGLSPVGPHLVNVLLHAINAALLFLLLQFATGFRWRSLMVAALFALHPINVESVAWAAERKNVLSTLFFLLALYAYEWYARKPERRRYAWVVGLYALALMAKPQVITFPLLLVLWDYWPLRRVASGHDAASATSGDFPKMSSRQLLWEKWPLLLLSAVSAIVTMQSQQAGGAVKDLAHFGVLLRLENAVIAYVRYLKMAIWPAKLVALYPHPTKLFAAWQVAAASTLLVVITVVVLRARRQRYLAVGWFWFLGSLVPMIGLVQVGEQALADRYAYLSFIGLFVMVVWLLADWAQSAMGTPSSDWMSGSAASRSWLAVPAVCCLVVLGVFTYRQVGYWHDTESFFRRTIALTAGNWVAEKGLAQTLYKQGKNGEAISYVRAALAIRPDDVPGNLILGDYERAGGNLKSALEHYQLAADQARGLGLRSRAYGSLGYVYRQVKQPLKAKQSFEMALRVEPNQPIILMQLGLIAQLDDNDTATAVRYFRHAMALEPTDVGLILLANALKEEGKNEESDAILQRAEKLSKNIEAAEKQAESLLEECETDSPCSN